MNIKPHPPAPPATSPGPQPGLGDLSKVILSDDHRFIIDRAARHAIGPPPWQARKMHEMQQLLRLQQISPPGRLNIMGFDNTEALRVLIQIHVTAPTMLPGTNDLVVKTDLVTLDIRYPQDVMIGNVQGTHVARVQQPRFIWHPNVDHLLGVICLGISLPRNIPAFQIVLMCYEVLAMSNLMLDLNDPSGVLNADAARYWVSQNANRLPLTQTAFLEDRPL